MSDLQVLKTGATKRIESLEKLAVNDALAIFIMKKKRKGYLAGPMRSKPNFNHPVFDAAALKLRELGWQIYNPAEMDRVLDGHDYTGYTIEEQKEFGEENSARFAQRDLNILVNELHKRDGDAIILLEDWEDSIGATAEKAVGVWVGLRILTYEEALAEGRREVKEGTETCTQK